VAQSNDEYHKNEVSGGYLYRQPIVLNQTVRVFQTENSNTININNTFPNPANLKFHGFNVAYNYNFHRYFGVKGEISRVTNNEELRFPVSPPVASTEPNVRIKSALTNYVGGIQIKDNSKNTRVKPFVHALFGVGHEGKKLDCFGTPQAIGCSNPPESSKKSFAVVLGGGLDIKLSQRIDIRAIQIDFNSMKVVNGTVNPPAIITENSNKYRIGFGIVFH
jgi:opacity protein-like surface antigen